VVGQLAIPDDQKLRLTFAMVYKASKISASSSLPNIEDTKDIGLQNQRISKDITTTEKAQLTHHGRHAMTCGPLQRMSPQCDPAVETRTLT
jgi:hypothetical protein